MAERYRVVVADDDIDVRTLARRYLQRSGRFEVVAEAADGTQAVTAAAEHQPDVTLLDLHMPDTDGLTALPLIREAAPRCTVVVLSAIRQPEVADDALAAGATRFVPKHHAWKELAAQLLEALESGDALPVPGAHQRTLDLPGELTSGHHARRWLREALSAWDATDVLADAELLTTELINNAVVHAASAVSVRLRMDGDRLRVEVSDTGRGTLNRQETTVEDTGGRGLFLVDALSSAWGTSARSDRKLVWFELERAAPGPA